MILSNRDAPRSALAASPEITAGISSGAQLRFCQQKRVQESKIGYWLREHFTIACPEARGWHGSEASCTTARLHAGTSYKNRAMSYISNIILLA
jgi:hypothetical protein